MVDDLFGFVNFFGADAEARRLVSVSRAFDHGLKTAYESILADPSREPLSGSLTVDNGDLLYVSEIPGVAFRLKPGTPQFTVEEN